MASSGGVTRGYLRPGFSRSPPFLMIGLIITAGISAFNYWNLSAQYADLVKEITELQDHVQIVTLKRETAEKRVDALQQRLSESADQLGQMKISSDEKVRQIKVKDEEIERLKFEAKLAVELGKSHNTSLEELRLIKIELERYKFNNSLLQEKEFVLHSTVIDLKSKMAEMSQLLSQNRESAPFKVPPIQKLDNGKTGKQQTPESIAVNNNIIKDNYVNDGRYHNRNIEEQNADPGFGQFQDAGIEVEDTDAVKNANLIVSHKNRSGDVEAQNGNYDFGLWDNRNIPKEMPADDQLEEDDGGANSNKSVLAMPSLYVKPDQLSKTAAIPAINPLNQTGIKETNIGMGSIVRPQLPTNKSMSPIVKKMVEMDAFKRPKQEQYLGNQDFNSDQNGNAQHRPPLLDYFRNDVPKEQNNLEGNLEAPQFPDKKFRDVRSEKQNKPMDSKSLKQKNGEEEPLKEPVTNKVMAFNEVFNDNFVPSI